MRSYLLYAQYFVTVLRNIPGCAWWKSLVNKLNSLVAIPLRVRPHVPEPLWMFHVDLSIENPKRITVPAIWMRVEQMSSTHGAEYFTHAEFAADLAQNQWQDLQWIFRPVWTSPYITPAH